MFWFKKKKKKVEDEPVSVWKEDFSDCVTEDYLPSFSFCRCKNNPICRYAARYADVTLCSHPEHKSFIPPGSEPFDPRKGLFTD